MLEKPNACIDFHGKPLIVVETFESGSGGEIN